MKVILFGATGMVGQGVLRECLLDTSVESVLVISRNASGQQNPKLREIVQKDFFDLSPLEPEMRGYDACFFCTGVSSLGMTEEAYTRVTFDMTMAIARTLVKLNPGMTFVYVSGAGTGAGNSPTGQMWARVKAKTENALLGLGFKAAYMFRPGYIQPLDGVKTKTQWYGLLYAVMAPLYPVWKMLLPNYVTTTRQIGLAMIAVAQRGYSKNILESSDINSV